MNATTEIGQKYASLLSIRAGRLGEEKAKQASEDIDRMIKDASDIGLEEAARAVANLAEWGGGDYEAQYAETFSNLKKQREQLNSRAASQT